MPGADGPLSSRFPLSRATLLAGIRGGPARWLAAALGGLVLLSPSAGGAEVGGPTDASRGASEPVASPAAVAATAPEVDPARLARHVEILASDRFGGRGIATGGEALTVDYIAGRFREYGLEPAFPDGYLQAVPLLEATVDPGAHLLVSGAGARLTFGYASDVVVWSGRPAAAVRVDDSEMVFAGYGIVAPEYGWNDYAGLDARGKTVLVLVNDPGFATGDPGLFRGREMTYYGRWSYKFEEAARQGAEGVIIIHQTEPAAYGWDVVVNSWTGPRFTLRRAGADGHRLALEAWLREEPARRLLAAAGRDFEALTAAAARPGFRAVPLGLTASIGLESRLREVVSRNVVGWLPGSERPAETVLFSAHWDHFGTVENPAGDGIYNGAADNATGVAALLEQARIAAGDATPPRSLAFAAFTAEEYGLLGSLHFAENSPFPLPTMVAVLNMDRMNHLGRARDVLVRGYGASELDEYLVQAAARQDRIVVGDPFPERGLYFRSDHFSLARFGVPGLHARSGVDDRERGRAWGVERENDYLRRLYHTPDDEYSRDWDLTGAAEDAQLYLDIARRLAGERRFPAWSAHSEFRAVRARTAAARGAASGGP